MRSHIASYEEIEQTVCQLVGCEPAAIACSDRHRTTTLAVALISYLCHRHANMSYPEIARSMRRSDGASHTTAITADQRMRRWLLEGRRVITGRGGDCTIGELRDQAIERLSRCDCRTEPCYAVAAGEAA